LFFSAGIICRLSVSQFLAPDDWRLFPAPETGARRWSMCRQLQEGSMEHTNGEIWWELKVEKWLETCQIFQYEETVGELFSWTDTLYWHCSW